MTGEWRWRNDTEVDVNESQVEEEFAEGDDPDSRGLYYALLDSFGEEVAEKVEASASHSSLVEKVRRLEQAGVGLEDAFDAVSFETVRQVPDVTDPAAYLLRHLPG